MIKHILSLGGTLSALLFPISLAAQVVINEGSNMNSATVPDEDAEYQDWIELYNAGVAPVNLAGYGLSDSDNNLFKWVCPSYAIQPGEFILVFASGKDRSPFGYHWETAIYDNDLMKLYANAAAPPAAWRQPGFNDNGWTTGPGGFGYGDNDDGTTTAQLSTIYVRETFNVADTSQVWNGILHMDYDDGFVAFLNGVEIARSLNMSGNPPAHNDLAAYDHEATIYQGGNPEAFTLDRALFKSLLVPGTNVLAFQLHNATANSSDLTLRPFLSLQIADGIAGTYGPVPGWFGAGGQNSAWHTNFKIKPAGEMIYLTAPGGLIVDSLNVANESLDHSVGCATDGSATRAVFTTPTPNASNNTETPYFGYEPAPIIVTAPGHYANNVQVVIQNPSPTAVVRYTTDGQNPTVTSPLYTGPINVNQTQTIRAKCFSNVGKLSSRTATSSYLINDNYTLPIIFLSTDTVNLVGPDGIFDNWWTDWEKQGYVEYFDVQGNQIFEQRTSFRPDGGAGGSRSNPQHSMKIDLNHELFGDGKINYPLNPNRPAEEYANFYLRNGSNFWNTLPYKDAAMQRSTGFDTHALTIEYTPAIVFVNGSYFGVYEVREKTDDTWLENNFNANPDSVDVLSMSYWYGADILRVVTGSDADFTALRQFIANGDPADPNYLATVGAQLDLENFADYMALEFWNANLDWLYNNMKVVRSRTTDNKWKFVLQDIELGANAWGNAYSDMYNYLEVNYGYTIFSQMFLRLLQNTEFHDYFINRFADLMNTELLTTSTNPVVQAMHAQIRPEMTRQYARWDPGRTLTDFDNARNYYLTDFNAQRTPVVRDQTETYFALNKQVNITLNTIPAGAGRIQINTIEPGPLPWTGVYFDGVPVTVTVFANPGYNFLGWLPNQQIPNGLASSFTTNVTNNTTFTAFFNGNAAPPLVGINEFNYNSEASIDAGDWVELYNYGQVNVDLNGWTFKDNDNTHIFPLPDQVLAPGERLVLVADVAKFTTQHPGVSNFVGPIGFSLGGTTDQLRLFDYNDTLKYFIEYVDSLWPIGADAGGRTVEQLDPTSPPNNPANWFDGCVGGSPGVAYSPCNDPVFISEINYNSNVAYNMNDWVELHNGTNQPIDLTGWRLRDDNNLNTYTLPAGSVIAPYGYMVLAQTPATFAMVHPTVPTVGPFVFNYSGDGELIRLYDANGRLRFAMNYDDQGNWPIEPDGQGYTLELADSSGHFNDGANWFAGCLTGSPGEPYDPGCGVTGVDPLQAHSFGLYPNPANGGLITLQGRDGALVNVEVFDMAGHLALHLQSVQTGQPLLGLETLPNGVWNVTITDGTQRESVRLTIIR